MRTVFHILLTTALVLLLYILVPSSLFLRPLDVVFNPTLGEITFKRLVRWPGKMSVRYAHSFIKPDGRICLSSGIREYDPEKTEDIVIATSKTTPCLNDPGTVYYMSWSVLLFDTIPLRSVTFVKQGTTAEGSWLYDRQARVVTIEGD
jgi:hypothetical protein